MSWVRAVAAKLEPGVEVAAPGGYRAEVIRHPHQVKGAGALVLVRYTGGPLINRDANLQVSDLMMED